jgi:hypothetical protein
MQERDSMDEVDIDGGIILKGILKNRMGWHGLD